MTTNNKSNSKDEKPGTYLKVVARHGSESEEQNQDGKLESQQQSDSQQGDQEGDEQYGDGDAFDDEDGKGEGSGPRERRKIEIKFIQNKARRHITFSKRKHGIMKKAWELSVLTGTQVLLLVVSETGLVYTFTTPKLQPLVTQSEGKNLIQACLNAPESPMDGSENSPEPSNEGSDGEMSPQANHATADEQIRAQSDSAANAQILAIRKAQAAQQQEAQNRLAAQQGHLASPPVVQNPQEAMSPHASGQQAAAVRAALQAQAQAQALAVSGLPPHIQQFAAQGYKIPPAQYGYHGYPFSAVGGQYGAQLANMAQSGQFGGQPLDTATLLAMQHQEGVNSHGNNGEYQTSIPQPPQPPTPGNAQGQN